MSNEEVNDFKQNDNLAKERELRYFSWLYKDIAGSDGSYGFAHGESDWARSLQYHGVDVEVKRGKENGRMKYDWYDNKIVNWPKTNKPYIYFCLETLSCSKFNSMTDGWMHTCRADKLTYAFEQSFAQLDLPLFFDTYVIQDMQSFKKWFWRLDLTRYQIHTEKEKNCTRSVLMPVQEVLEAFPDTHRYFVFDGFVIPVWRKDNIKGSIISLLPNLQEYIRKKYPTKIISLPVRREKIA